MTLPAGKARPPPSDRATDAASSAMTLPAGPTSLVRTEMSAWVPTRTVRASSTASGVVGTSLPSSTTVTSPRTVPSGRPVPSETV